MGRIAVSKDAQFKSAMTSDLGQSNYIPQLDPGCKKKKSQKGRKLPIETVILQFIIPDYLALFFVLAIL